jgi:sulfate adenylyltransferase
LVNLVVGPDRAAQLRRDAAHWPQWRLSRRQRCDLELLANGAFSPLESFLGEADYDRVCRDMRLADGTLWPIPVTLDLPGELVRAAPRQDGMLALCDTGGELLATLEITEAWQPDHLAEARSVLGSDDPAHPGVHHLLHGTRPWYVTGRLEVTYLPGHREFPHLRHTPAQLRAHFTRHHWDRIVAFQTRNPMHRAHQELTLRAAHEADAKLLIHPVVGVTKPGDLDAHIRVRCYQAILRTYPQNSTVLSLLPLAMRMAGPREALWHAIIRKNYGATHFIVGRDHAGPGLNAQGQRFYGLYDSQRLAQRHAAELGIEILAFPQMVYSEDHRAYLPENAVPAGAQVLSISGTELRRLLGEGQSLPSWFTCTEVAAELHRAYDMDAATR